MPNVEVPGVGVVEFPDTMTGEQIVGAIQKMKNVAAKAPTTRGGLKAAAGGFAKQASDAANIAIGKPPGFNFSSGVPDMGIRARLSLADTPEEAQAVAGRIFGPDAISRAPGGGLAVSPDAFPAAGLARPEGDSPVLIDERGVTPRDLADVAGSLPEFLGATGAAMRATGAGFIPGLLASGAGALAGKALGETGEHLAGENTQSFGDVAADVAKAGGAGMLGEGVYRGVLAPIGRAAMSPGASIGHWFSGNPYIEPERLAQVRAAQDLGGRPSVSQVTQHPILGRLQEAAEMFTGGGLERHNAQVLQQEMQRLTNSFGGGNVTRGQAGQAVKDAIGAGRREMSQWASQQARQLDDMTGGARVLPTEGFRARLQEMFGDMPQTSRTVQEETGVLDAAGNPITREVEQLTGPIGVPSETLTELRKYMDVRDNLTFGEWQRMRTDLRQGISSGTLMPGVSSRDAQQMVSALDGVLDDAVSAGTVPQALTRRAQEFRTRYREQADRFSDAMVERVARSPRFAGALDPEEVTRQVVRPGNHSQVRRVMNLLPQDTQEQVRETVMRDILQGATRGNPRNSTEEVFTGTIFRDKLNRDWGEETLQEVFGPAHARELARFADAQALLAEKQPMIGGLAVANVALHPWKNLGTAVRFNLAQRMLMNPTMLRYFTEGARAPRTRAGSAALARVATMAQTMLDSELED